MSQTAEFWREMNMGNAEAVERFRGEAERLQHENDRLRKALEPFAMLGEKLAPYLKICTFPVSYVLSARAALSAGQRP